MPATEKLTITRIELSTTLPEIPIQVFETEKLAAKAAAQHILTTVIHKPDARIMFATGKTQEPVYEALVDLARATKVDFSGIQAFHLDEYDGVSPEDNQSFIGFLRKRVFDPLGIPDKNRHEMRGDTGNSQTEVDRYNSLIKEKPMDLVILGIGPGGHIAFNEPGTPFAKQTHVAPLSRDTKVRDEKRGQRVFTHALTVGPANILNAHDVVLVGYGKEKGEILSQALHGVVSPDCPASILQKISDRVTAIVDREAANVIQRPAR